MAMKTASPWWFSALFAAGLFLVFLGERPLGHLDEVRLVVTGVGLALIVALTGLRAWTFMATRGARRSVERTLLLCQIGAVVALGLYALSTSWGQGLFGVNTVDAKALQRFTVPMTVLWSIVMVASLVPMLMIELSLGTARRTHFVPAALAAGSGNEEAVESFRVREMAGSGLTVALAAALLMVTCNIATQRNVRHDVSYFKTSSPGSAAINVVKSVSEPIKVYLFFPQVNETRNEIRGYFESLKAAAGNLEIEEHDRMLSAALAKEFKVNDDGTVVLRFGDKSESIKFTLDPKRARSRAARTELRELDSRVNAALMKIVRMRKTVYLTSGHGELNDDSSEWARAGLRAGELKRRLRDMNTQVKDLGISDGLATEVPEDADLIMLIGPQQDLLPEEMAALDRYLARGGRMLIALDPSAEASLGILEGRLGLRFNPTPILDDRQFLARTRTPRDHVFIITDRFSSHASITTLTRQSARVGMLFLNTGSLDEVELSPGLTKTRRTHVIRSMATSFADTEPNLRFDEATEKRQQYNLATAVEDPTAQPEGKPDHEGMRVMVFADVEIFDDMVLMQIGGAQAMLDDAVKWLAGEDHFAGEVVSEQDVVIEHTRNEDVLWFYSTIVGAPLVVLAFGLWFGWRRRQRMQRRSS